MENYILLGLLFILFVVPFAYIIVVDIIEITRRIAEAFNMKIKPITISVINNLIK